MTSSTGRRGLGGCSLRPMACQPMRTTRWGISSPPRISRRSVSRVCSTAMGWQRGRTERLPLVACEPHCAEALAGTQPRRRVVGGSAEHDDPVGALEVGLAHGESALVRGGRRGARRFDEELHPDPHPVVEQGDRVTAPLVGLADQVVEPAVRNRPGRESPPVRPPLGERGERPLVNGLPGRRQPDPGEQCRARGAGHPVDRGRPAERARGHLQVVQGRAAADHEVAAHGILGEQAEGGVGVQLDDVTVDAPGPGLGVVHARGGARVLDDPPGLGVRQTAAPRVEGGRA